MLPQTLVIRTNRPREVGQAEPRLKIGMHRRTRPPNTVRQNVAASDLAEHRLSPIGRGPSRLDDLLGAIQRRVLAG
jgi:hypothetical protein